MSNYEVHYNISVNTNGAETILTNFKTATAGLDTAATNLAAVSKALNSFNNASKKFTGKPLNIKITIDPSTTTNLRNLTEQLRAAKTEAQGLRTALAGAGVAKSPARQRPAQQTATKNTVIASSSSAKPRTVQQANAKYAQAQYKALGPTPFATGNIPAVEFLKGMGIAYTISGIGQAVSSIVKSATEYDTLIKSSLNILKTHDKKGNFDTRFREMEGVIRQIGVETKYTAPQVADAAKFLAMAGFNIDDIKATMRPIADIALVGDTDLAQTADVVTNIMSGYGIKSKDMRRAADVMTMTFTKSNTTLMEMAEAYKYSASLLSAGGVTFDESAAALGILGDAGIKGSQAGTTLRTIMANINAPTKKQMKNWMRIGINPVGKDPIEVFTALNKIKDNLEIGDFYGLFHKTAAQGAVSLMNNVEKWNEIIADNFLSKGLTSKLAEEKKNTLEGLWAQLTSMFTEDGMQAFGGVQETIKGVLKTGIEWLKDPKTVAGFKSFTKDLMEFMHKMLDSAKQIYTIFKKFSPIIKGFISLQVKLMPVLAIVKAISSIINLGRGIMTMPMSVATSSLSAFGLNGTMPGSVMGLGGAMGGAGAMIAGGGASPAVAGYVGSINNLWGGKKLKKMYGVDPKDTLNPATTMRIPFTNKRSRLLGWLGTSMSGGQALWHSFDAERVCKAAYKDWVNNSKAAVPLNKKIAEYASDTRSVWKNYIKDYATSNGSVQRLSVSQLKDAYYNFFGGGPYTTGVIGDWADVQKSERKKLEAERKKLGGDYAKKLTEREVVKFKLQRGISGGLTAATGIGSGFMLANATGWSGGGVLMGGLMTAGSLASLGSMAGVWGAIAVGVASAGYAVYKYFDGIIKAREEVARHAQQVKDLNIQYIGENASVEARMYSLAYDRNLNLNQQVAARLQMMRELNGLDPSPTPGSADTTGFKSKLEGYDKSVSFFLDNIEVKKDFTGIMQDTGLATALGFRFNNSTGSAFIQDYRKAYKSETMLGASLSGAIAALMEDALTSSERTTALKNFGTVAAKSLWNLRTEDSLDNVLKEYEASYGKKALYGYWLKQPDGTKKYVPGRIDMVSHPVRHGDASYFKEYDGSQLYRDWTRTNTIALSMNNYAYGGDVAKAIEAYRKQEATGTMTEKVMLDLISRMDTELSTWVEAYIQNGVTGVLQAFNWDSNKHMFAGGYYTDPFTQQTKYATGREFAQMYVDFCERINKLIPRLTDADQKSLLDFSDKINRFLNFAKAGTYDADVHGPLAPNPKKYTIGATFTAEGGKKYKQIAPNQWAEVDSKGNPRDPLSGEYLSTNQIEQLDQMKGKPGSNKFTSDDPYAGLPDRTHTPTGGDSGYQNRYSSSVGTPKQTNIAYNGPMLQIDKIDLSKPDNQYAVNSIKEQLLTALLEARSVAAMAYASDTVTT